VEGRKKEVTIQEKPIVQKTPLGEIFVQTPPAGKKGTEIAEGVEFKHARAGWGRLG